MEKVKTNYLESNLSHWSQGYAADNVESFVFRPYGRILKPEFGLSGARGEKLLDFGCGAGAALKFFKSKGFDVYGVDISKIDIARCREKMPDVKNHFQVIDPKPSKDKIFFKGRFDLTIAIQSLYYLSDDHFKACLARLYKSMNAGGLIYATMIGKEHYLYRHSKLHGNGLRKVNFSSSRLQVDDHFINFTHSKAQLVEKFGIFEKRRVGYYDENYNENKERNFHYTFIGQKQ